MADDEFPTRPDVAVQPEGVSYREVLDESTGKTSKEVIDWRQSARAGNLRPSLFPESVAPVQSSSRRHS